jgi:hypothetical protein
MQSLLIPRRLSQQPAYTATIDWSNPITQGLVGAFCPTSGNYNIVDPELKLTSNIAIARKINNFGLAWSQQAGTAQLRALVASTPFTTSTAGYTCFWAGQILGANIGTADSFLIGVSYATTDVSPYVSYGLCSGNGTGSPTGVYARVGYVAGSIPTTIPVVTGAYNTYGASFDLAGNAITYNNGILFSTYTQPLPTFSAGSTLSISGYYPVSTRSPNVAPALALVFNRVLSVAEHASLAANPWQIFSNQVC